MVLGLAFDHLAQTSLEVRRNCGDRLALLYCPNSMGGRWVSSSSRRRLFILVDELMRDFNNQLCLLMILEKLRVVPYYVFYGSFYVGALLQPLEHREYASHACFDLLTRYIPRSRIYCLGRFHHGFTGETNFDQIVKIDPSAP